MEFSQHNLSHELGHGRTALHHTFEDDYIAKYATTNLMDYSANDSLVRYQWQNIHDPAVFDPVQDDEDGAIKTDDCPAATPTDICSLEGKKIVVLGKRLTFSPDGLPLGFVDCPKTFYYHIGDKPQLYCCNNQDQYYWEVSNKSGWYSEKKYSEIIEPITRSLAVLNGDVIVVRNRESIMSDASYRLEEFFKGRSISDNFLEAVSFNYRSICDKANKLYSGSGGITPVNIELDIALMFSGIGEITGLFRLVQSRVLTASGKMIAVKLERGIALKAIESGEILAKYSDNLFEITFKEGRLTDAAAFDELRKARYVSWGNSAETFYPSTKLGTMVENITLKSGENSFVYCVCDKNALNPGSFLTTTDYGTDIERAISELGILKEFKPGVPFPGGLEIRKYQIIKDLPSYKSAVKEITSHTNPLEFQPGMGIQFEVDYAGDWRTFLKEIK